MPGEFWGPFGVPGIEPGSATCQASTYLLYLLYLFLQPLLTKFVSQSGWSFCETMVLGLHLVMLMVASWWTQVTIWFTGIKHWSSVLKASIVSTMLLLLQYELILSLCPACRTCVLSNNSTQSSSLDCNRKPLCCLCWFKEGIPEYLLFQRGSNKCMNLSINRKNLK